MNSMSFTKIDYQSDPRKVKGRAAERLVANILCASGYQVKLTKSMGPDIEAEKGGRSVTIEVKTPSCPGGKIGFTIGTVSPNRINDDLLVVVFHDGRIHVESMKSHLKLCPSGGSRSLYRMYHDIDYRARFCELTEVLASVPHLISLTKGVEYP